MIIICRFLNSNYLTVAIVHISFACARDNTRIQRHTNKNNMVSSTAVIFLLAVLTATEASSPHRVGREADFQASQTTFETAAAEAGEVVEEVDSVAADTVVAEDAAVLEVSRGDLCSGTKLQRISSFFL